MTAASNEHYVIYGRAADGAPLLMCAPEQINPVTKASVCWLDDEDLSEVVHLVSIISNDWSVAREVYDALWAQVTQ